MPHRPAPAPTTTPGAAVALVALFSVLSGCPAAPSTAGPAAAPPDTAPAQRDASASASPATASRPSGPRSTTPACPVEFLDGAVRTPAGPTPLRVAAEVDQAPSARVAVFAGGPSTVLVALRRGPESRPSADGVLWSVPCDAPGDATPLLRRAGADFGAGALSPDGWTLLFSDARGLAALDLDRLEVRPVSDPGPAWPGCTDASAGLRDELVSLSPDGRQLRFHRGGPCGMDGRWVSRPWLLLEPLNPTGRIFMEQRPLASLAAVPPSTLWLSDGEGCDEPGVVAPHTRGALWRSDDAGETWTRVEVRAGDDRLGPMAAALLTDAAAPDTLVVHAATCSLSGVGRTGGEVYATRDRGATWQLIWAGQALSVAPLNTGLDTLVVTVADGRRYASRDLGATWLDLDPRPSATLPARLAPSPVRLGTSTFAPQGDGLYRREGPGTRPVRVFPPAAAH